MVDLLPRVWDYAVRHELFSSGQAVVVGVSAGPDSLCLLHLLQRLQAQRSLRLTVAHLNHGLRGIDAEADEQFVASIAERWDLPFVLGRADVAALAARIGASTEEAARLARYAFLADTALNCGAEVIAVGHHADDQAETVLMHFLRGSGVAGLRGMLPRTRLDQYRLPETARNVNVPGRTRDTDLPESAMSSLWVVRPLLAVPRAEIEAYCAAYGLAARYDQSNDDTTYYRNRLRHQLLPVLAQYNPAISAILTHTAEVMAADHEVLREALEAALTRIELPSAPDEVQFDLAAWRALPLGLQRASLREAVGRLRRGLRNINWVQVERAVWLAREVSSGASATLVAGLELRIGYDALRVAGEGAPWPVNVPQLTGVISVTAPGLTELPDGWQVTVRRVPRADLPPDFEANPDPWTAYVDADIVGPLLNLRPRVPGDRFRPQGMEGQVRLNEFMINLKVPRDVRPGWPLLTNADGIVWACGLRLDGAAVVGPQTSSIWQVRIESASGRKPWSPGRKGG